MSKKNITSSLLLLSFTFFSLFNLTIFGKITFFSKPIDHHTYQFTLKIDLASHDFMYKDYINFSVDHPAVILSEWHSSIDPVPYYDQSFKETKLIYNKNFSIQLTATTKQETIQDAYLYFTYYQQSKKKIDQKLFNLNLSNNAFPLKQELPSQKNEEKNAISITKSSPKKQHTSWVDYVSGLINNTNSLLLKILLVLLLGIVMSLTPCIYPMIPITLGILQSQGSYSIIRSFLLALAYTIGIASTFALLGLIAVFTGQLFGSFLTHPLVVVPVAGLLGYLGFSMLGFYQMYTPKFWQFNKHNNKNGSLITAFLFGAASGTVASPCLSPGLVLLLSIVATIGDTLLGFVLLFSFGIGLSLPLLLIGTFSSSLALLPNAGSWMIEVKKLFGFMLLGMCFYFLKNILPWSVLMWGISLTTIAIGLFYVYQAQAMKPSARRFMNNTIGTVLLASSVLLFFKSYQTSNPIEKPTIKNLWLSDFKEAQAFAQQEHKKILLDISAPFCTICKAIDNTLFANQQVQKALDAVVPVKIDCSDSTNKIYHALQKRYAIMGAPTFILIDPTTQKEIKRWGSELYEVTAKDFIAELNKYAQKD